jgi:DNA-binding beta-propeller fold protein YncE
MRGALPGVGLALIALGPAFAAGTASAPAAVPAAIALPGGDVGIGFDDLGYSAALGRVLVPGGRTGKLFLVDPATYAVTSIPGFGTAATYTGGHRDGITSVTEGAGFLFVVDRTRRQLCIVDPAKKAIVSRAPLGAAPDYVRWIDPTHEIWVTEPESARVEMYRLVDGKPPHAVRVATVATEGGPEALTLDLKHRRAYTNIAAGTAAIDIRSRAVVALWDNACNGASGIALDTARGFLFVAGFRGGVRVLDLANGAMMDSTQLGAGVDIVSYSPELGHLYVPSSRTSTLAILGVSNGGALSTLGTFPGTADSHSVAAGGKVFFCDPPRGRLLAVTDPYPASAH